MGMTLGEGTHARIIQVIARHSDRVVSPDSTLESLNIDSLGMVTLIYELENELDCNADDVDFSNVKTVDDLIQLFVA